MKNLSQLLACYLLRILPQGFTLNGIKANCKDKKKKRKLKTSRQNMCTERKGAGGGALYWRNFAF